MNIVHGGRANGTHPSGPTCPPSKYRPDPDAPLAALEVAADGGAIHPDAVRLAVAALAAGGCTRDGAIHVIEALTHEGHRVREGVVA